MGLFVPPPGGFKWIVSNGTPQPAAAFGASIIPTVSPTMSSWLQLFTGATVATDVYGVMINFNSGSSSATTRNYLVDIGVDPTGGTAYTVKIPYLLAGHSSPYNVGSGGIWYYFPLFIKAGSSIAARAMGTTVTSFKTYITLFGQPKYPDSVSVGEKVFSFGQTTANATGTTVTLGTTLEGAWVQVGTALTMPLWWWQVGYACVDTTMTLATVHCDVGAGSAATKKILIQDVPWNITAAEQIANIPTYGSVNVAATGDIIYVRGQSSTTADTAISMMAWGLG